MGNWDNDIDEVARRMTEGGPGADFKAQVLARIEAVDSTRGPRRLVWTGWAVALAATGAMVLMSVWPVRKTDTVRLTPATSDTVPLTPDTTYDKYPASGGAVTAADRTLRAAAPTASRDRSSGMSGFNGTEVWAPGGEDRTGLTIASDRIDRLQPLPIQVEQLVVDAMDTMDAIEVQGLDITPLEVPVLAIALLDVPVLGDESFEGRVQ